MSDSRLLIIGIISILVGIVILITGWGLLAYFGKTTYESSWVIFGGSCVFWVFGAVAVVSSK